MSEESAPYVVKSETFQKLAELADGLESDGRYMLQLSDLTPEALSAVATTKLTIASQIEDLLAEIQRLSEKGALGQPINLVIGVAGEDIKRVILNVKSQELDADENS